MSEQIMRVLVTGSRKWTDRDTIRDARCSLLKPGDPVALWCIRDWQYSSESGWRCRWGGGDV